MANLSLRETLRRYLPPWLSDARGPGAVGFRFVYAFGAFADGLVQWLIEGIRARFPEVATPTALPYLGRDRRIIRGAAESAAAFAARLVLWLEYWRYAGAARSVALHMQAFLFPGYPMVRIVSRKGMWVTLTADGTVEVRRAVPNNWNWDSVTHPELADNWADFWVIVYEPHYETDGTWGDGTSFWGESKVWGQDAPASHAAAIKAIIKQWKGAHARCVCVIFTYDPDSFSPLSAVGAPGMPDGYWGRWSKDVAGVRRQSRRTDCRYWEV